MILRRLLQAALLTFSSLALCQTGLQGFDRNYPDTPAGDNPRGFTPQVMPVVRPAPPPPAAASKATEAADPFTAPDPMLEESTEDDGDDSSADGS
jgi:hypothetical protein